MMTPIFEPTQPFLLSSLVFSIILAFSTYFSLKILKVNDHRLKSILYTMPMLVPLVVYTIFFLPSAFFPLRTFCLPPKMGATFGGIEIDGMIKIPNVRFFMLEMLYLVGLTFGSALLTFSYFFGSRTVCWLQGVEELTPQENPLLMDITQKLAEKAGLPVPRVGINEDLRPNAFTIGRGRKAMIVVTLGLLKKLNGVELEAVIAHEIAHIKNQDFHFMTLISTLKAISFFNPLVYLLSPAIKKEREFLADSTGAELIEQPEALGLALTKVWESFKIFSRSSFRQWFSGLFIISEIRQARNVLTTHPPLESRLRNIAERNIRTKVSKDETINVVLVCILITIVSMNAFGLVIQTLLPFGRMYGFGPGNFWFRWVRSQVNRPDLDFYPYITTMKADPHSNLNYTWILSSIDIMVILTISLKSSLQNNFKTKPTINSKLFC
jgi:heat shock protein HtpX